MALGITGCQILGPKDPRTETMSDYRALWDEFQSGSYTFTLGRGCYCIVAGEIQVTVEEGNVTSAYSVWQNEAVLDEHLQFIETIDTIFDMIDRAKLEAHELEVEYAVEGYPTLVSIDWIELAVDDEITLTVSDVTPVK